MKTNVTETKKQAQYVVKKLKSTYPDAYCELVYTTPVELLVATVLSAQCTDVMVNRVTKTFFKNYKLPYEVADLKISEIEKEIKSIGLYRSKAKNIKALCQKLIRDHGGEVPSTLKDLVELSGVGRKTANVVLGEIFNTPEGVVVDTHVKRLSNRLGLVKSDNPVVIERELMKLIPKKHWVQFAHWMIFHGRKTCKASSPQCGDCGFKRKCYHYQTSRKVK